MPDVDSTGNLRGFLSHQIYSSTKGFPVNTKDEYEMTMVYHLNRQEKSISMAWGIIFFT